MEMRRPIHHTLGVKLRRVGAALLAACAAALAPATAAWGNHNTTEIVSTGPNGGNGAVSSQFRGASAGAASSSSRTRRSWPPTPTRGWTSTSVGRHTTLLSTGPNGGNGAFNVRSPRTARRDPGLLPHLGAAGRIRHRHHTGRVRALQRHDPRVDRSQWWQRRLPGDLRRNLPGRIEGVLRHRGVTVAGDRTAGQRRRLPAVQWDDDLLLDRDRSAGGRSSHASPAKPGRLAPPAPTAGPLEASDIDEMQDVYVRSGGATSHLDRPRGRERQP